jgi:hypothetical protein
MHVPQGHEWRARKIIRIIGVVIVSNATNA